MSTPVNRKNPQTTKAPSAKISRLLDAMQGKDGNQHQVRSAWLDLDELVIKDGQWTPASASTLNAAIEQLKTAAFPEYLLWLIADILMANGSESWGRNKHRSPLESLEFKACLDLVDQKRDLILAEFGSSRPSARAGVATILGATLGQGGWEQSALEKHFSQETEPLVRSALLCALPLVDRTDRWPHEVGRIAHEGDSERLIWGAATLCWLRHNPQHDPTEVVAGIEAWLSSKLETDGQLQYLGLALQGQQPEVLARILMGQGESARTNALSALVALGRSTTIREVIVGLGYTFDSILGRPRPGSPDNVIPANELDADLRMVAEGLVDTWVYPKARWMPAAGERRRRWLGLGKPSILEMPAPEGLDSQTPPRPLWEVILDLDKSREPDQLLPPAIANALDSTSQWWVAVEVHGGAYGESNELEWDTMTECGSRLKVDDETAATIHSFCHEALARQRLLARYDSGSSVVTRLLFVPLVRSGRPIPEEFYDLIAFHNETEEREILATLDRGHVARVILDRLDAASPRGIYNAALAFLAVVDAIPSPEICEILVSVWDRMPELRHEDYRQKLNRVAEHVPEFKEALARKLKSLP